MKLNQALFFVATFLATAISAKDAPFSYTISIDGIVSTFVGPTTIVEFGQTVVISNTDYFSDAMGIVSQVADSIYGTTTFDTATMTKTTGTDVESSSTASKTNSVSSEVTSASSTSHSSSANSGGNQNLSYIQICMIFTNIVSYLMLL